MVFEEKPKLRDYQQRSLDDLKLWIKENPNKNGCLCLPTGSGKSWIIAAYCKDVIERKPDAHILMLTHVKELIEQNAEKIRLYWPNAPLGIYSAGCGSRDIDKITFASIQSIARNWELLGKIDVIVVDECHLINHKNTGNYRVLIEELKSVNPMLIVVGLTATPYRLGHGLITDSPAIFDDIIEPVSIEELQYKGYLAKLKSKVTNLKLNTDGVHKSGGEYIKKELQAHVNTSDNNYAIVDEVIQFAGDRKHWLFFCSGVDHALAIRDILKEKGISAEAVTGKTPKLERAQIISDFKKGKLQAVANVDVLSTGFDAPDIDLIAMLRPTMSPSLYIQQAGRGLRVKSNGGDCLVLDFAGVVEKHGPITCVNLPKKAGGGGTAPAKECPDCGEIIHASLMTCPECGHIFPPNEKEDLVLHQDDIQGDGSKEMDVNMWHWSVHTSIHSGKQSAKVTYFPNDMNVKPVTEFLCVMHGGFAGMKAVNLLKLIAFNANIDITKAYTLESLVKTMNNGKCPNIIVYKKNGKYFDIITRKYDKNLIREKENPIWQMMF